MTKGIDLPVKLQFLFEPHRYKVAYGGRSSTKSWSFARALLVQGASKKLRILCAREIQRSIKDSVHKLLSDQVEILGLGGFYTITDVSIRGRNGTEFFFAGLATQTVQSLKSFEGIDRCWVEEGQTAEDNSWRILIPTIRKTGSEIWVSFNPDLETDPTYQRFVVHAPPDACVVEISYPDNPWFNAEMEAERVYCLENDPDNYDNIWLGKCRPAVEGAIYFKEIQRAQENGQICHVPHDPLLLTHIVLDLGWNDSLSAGLVQRNVSEIRVIESIEASHTSLDVFFAELKLRPYTWGKVWLPHDGFAGQLNAGGRSTYDILTALKWDCAKRSEINELSIEDGIRNTRMTFKRCYFDISKTNADEAPPGNTDGFHATPINNRLVESLKRYKRQVNRKTLTDGRPTHDLYAHGADMFRYICANADLMLNDKKKKPRRRSVSYSPFDAAVGY